MSENQAANLNITSYESIIGVESQLEQQIPPQYWKTETGIVLAIAVLIRSIAILIQVLVQRGRNNPPVKKG
ncbi:MAG: hypothetical protein ICV63_00920 [Coleofasciculus sp. Co-bin14]|nr:hypothetical protein [Coleofasciculus sp. Co-bin14]